MSHSRKPIVLAPGEGRHYALGPMRAVFLADNEETSTKYSISEWWLEPYQPGPGAHRHEHNDDIFYVLDGPVTFQVDDGYFDVERGGCVIATAGTLHDFMNRTGHRVGLLNFYVPGGFEDDMPAIVEWYARQAKED